MRRTLRVVALATLVASCSDLPQQPTAPLTPVSLGGTANLPDLTWGRSTTDVPMFVMGTFNGRNVIPLDVNDEGVIVGILRLNGTPDRAFRWENGTFTDIGPASGASVAKAVENALVLEYLARLASETLVANPSAGPMQSELLDKHFLRKNGPGAYYGQR